jgi:integrase
VEHLHRHARTEETPRAKRARSTVDRYEELLRHHVRPYLGSRPLRELEPFEIQKLLDRLLVSGRRDRRPGGLAPQHVQHVHRALSLALRQAVRWLALPAFAVAALRRHHSEQVKVRLALGAEYRAAEDLVMARRDGRPIRPDYASARFAWLAKKAGLPAGAHLHTLRHSAASFLAADGVPPSDIAGVLGHVDGGALALRVYIRPLKEGIVRAAEHLEKAIGEGI